ncbi:MAG: hypothetical protein KJ000_00400 [Pirellulaceae bacterium]|nr:hypothetical protein [Pirellulaceae bacterium]
MADSATNTGSTATERRARWLFALVVSSIVTVAGLVAAVQQFGLKYLWDQSAHTRTIGGLLYMLLGVAGICLPVIVFRQKRRFLLLQPSRQWLLAIGVPLAYILAFALCMEASMRSTTLILARPFTPTAVIVYEPTDLRVEFRGGWKKNLESGYSGANMQRGDDRFSSHLYQGFLRHPRRETVAILGGVKQMDHGSVQIILDVVGTESVRCSVENLDKVEIRRDGQRIGESDSQSGTFQLTITGRPR